MAVRVRIAAKSEGKRERERKLEETEKKMIQKTG